MIYILMTSFLITLSFIEVTTKDIKLYQKKILIFFLCFLFMFLGSIRWERGTDWNSYYSYNMEINNINYDFEKVLEINETSFEIGYTLLNYIVSIFSNSYTVFLFILSSIIFIFMTKFLIDNLYINNDLNCFSIRNYPVTMILVLWCTQLGNIFFVRSTVAYSILLYSTRYIKRKEVNKFIVMVLIASFIHRSSLIFLISYPLYYLKINNRNIFIILICFLVFLLEIDNILIGLGNILGGAFEYKINGYVSSNTDYSFSIKAILNRLLPLIILFVLYKFDSSKVDVGFINLYFFGFLIHFVFSAISPTLPRMAEPFLMVQIILFPSIFNYFSERKSKMIVFFIFILYMILREYSFLIPYWDLYIPFKSIFNIDLKVKLY